MKQVVVEADAEAFDDCREMVAMKCADRRQIRKEQETWPAHESVSEQQYQKVQPHSQYLCADSSWTIWLAPRSPPRPPRSSVSFYSPFGVLVSLQLLAALMRTRCYCLY